MLLTVVARVSFNLMASEQAQKTSPNVWARETKHWSVRATLGKTEEGQSASSLGHCRIENYACLRILYKKEQEWSICIHRWPEKASEFLAGLTKGTCLPKAVGKDCRR